MHIGGHQSIFGVYAIWSRLEKLMLGNWRVYNLVGHACQGHCGKILSVESINWLYEWVSYQQMLILVTGELANSGGIIQFSVVFCYSEIKPINCIATTTVFHIKKTLLLASKFLIHILKEKLQSRIWIIFLVYSSNLVQHQICSNPVHLDLAAGMQLMFYCVFRLYISQGKKCL